MPFGGGKKTQQNGQKLGPAPRQRALSNCPCSAAAFGAEPNCTTLQLPYPPDLTPRNFCHFSRPKSRLKGHHFTSAEEIQQNIAACLRAISKDDFQRHFQQWLDCWNKLYVQKRGASSVT